jgi:beta-phosphoglucomutase-like phosphatase (HAD superfamily)
MSIDHKAKLDQSNSLISGPLADPEREISHDYAKDGLFAPLRAVLLDVDGTLVDSNAAHAGAWSRAAGEFGYVRPPEFFRELIGMGADWILPRIDPDLTAESDPGKALATRRGEIFLAAYAPSLQPMPGSKALVERLRETGLQCVIASSSKGEELEALLAIAGITDLVEKQTPPKGSPSKPAPNVVESALQRAHAHAEETLLLGDTPYDIEAASNANVAAVALRCGGWPDDALAAAIAIYDDPAHVLAEFDASPFMGRSVDIGAE